jgi:Cu(I)/Ag(I) efflux system membrane fusion protein
LAEARQEFKFISRDVLQLAAEARGEGAELSFTHFYCPMVPGGSGDWLQPTGATLNPYLSSQMRSCGEKAHEFPAPASSASEVSPRPEQGIEKNVSPGA